MAQPVADVMVVVVMGVSGSGKTTLGESLAARTGRTFLDADSLHTPEAVAQMRSGVALTDDQRWPWLDRIGAWMEQQYAADRPSVVACSALRKAYRDRLRSFAPDLRLVYLRVNPDTAAHRVTDRAGHFFPAPLVAGQLGLLEEPTADELPIVVHSGRPIDLEVDEIVLALTG